MCELLGFTVAEERDAAPYMRQFITHSCAHPHGWGMAVMGDRGFGVVKEPLRADESVLLDNILQGEIRTKVMMGHIRYATVGNVGYTNCHPFVQTDSSGREWVFFHNGTMFRGELVADYAHAQIGTTDSERILLYLMDRINEATKEKGTLSCLEHFRILSQAAADLSRGNNKLNLLIYNGHTLFVHTNMEGTLFQKKIDGGYVFATSPLDRDGDWQQVPMRRMLAYRDGIRLYEGEPISEEYFFRQADIDRLYQVFSEL